MSKAKNKPGIHLLKGVAKKWSKKKGYSFFGPSFYWHFVATNGRIIARSSEVYSSKRSAIKSIQIMANYFEGNQHYYDHTTGGVPDLVVYSVKK